MLQYYFETIFPRIPKKVSDGIIDYLKQHNLPTVGRGNGGVGGPDRRGVDEPNRRPASVKASLSVAFGQRAPNRAGAREEGRGRDPSAKEISRDRIAPPRERRSPPPSPPPKRVNREVDEGRAGHRDSHGYRSRSPNDRWRDRRPYDYYDRSRHDGRRDVSPVRRRSRSRDRSRDRGSRDRYSHKSRDVREVFREDAGGRRMDDSAIKSRYG